MCRVVVRPLRGRMLLARGGALVLFDPGGGVFLFVVMISNNMPSRRDERDFFLKPLQGFEVS